VQFIFGVGHFTERFSGVSKPTSPNLARTKGIIAALQVCFKSSDIVLHFQTQTFQIWVMLKTTPNFALF